jgi:hypothetical protein
LAALMCGVLALGCGGIKDKNTNQDKDKPKPPRQAWLQKGPGL